MLHLTNGANHLAHFNPFNHNRNARIQHSAGSLTSILGRPQRDSIALSKLLSIPLLCDEIASTLSSYQLSLCTQVCRAWNQAFSPVLWANLSFDNQYTVSLFRTSSAIQQAIVQKHARHIRSIHSVFCYTFDSLPIQPNLFLNLTRLDSLASELHNKGIVDHTNAVRLLQFIKVNTSLREIRLIVFPLVNAAVSELLGTILAEHLGLVTVSITCFTEAHLEGMRHILRGAALGQVESLRLICRTHRHNNVTALNHGTILNSNSTLVAEERKYETKALLPEGYVARYLKELHVEADLEHIYGLTILPLLEHCPNLESFLITGLNIGQSMHELCKVMDRASSNLRHLTVACAKDGQDENYARLLNACQTDRLQSLVLQNGLFFGRHSIQALLSCSHQHRFSLQILDLENCWGVESRDLQLILTSCPNLTIFLAMAAHGRTTSNINNNGNSNGGNYATKDMRIHIKDLPTEMGNKPAWVCLRLQQLSIGFTGFLSQHQEHQSRSRPFRSEYLFDDEDIFFSHQGDTSIKTFDSIYAKTQHYVDHIYSQLALLTDLKTLRLGGEIGSVEAPRLRFEPCGAFDLTLRSGLSRLSTLTRLEELDVQKIWHHRIGSNECAWIGKTWPRLRKFRMSSAPALPSLSMDSTADVTFREQERTEESIKSMVTTEMKRHCPKVEVWIGTQRIYN